MAEQTNDPIDEIAVKLSLDSSAFASDLDGTMKDAEDRAQEAADKISSKFSGMTTGDKLMGLNVAASAQKTGVSIKEMAQAMVDMTDAGGMSVEQLTALGNAANTADFDMKDLADVVKMAGEQLGVSFSPEVTNAMATGLQSLIGVEGGLATAYEEAIKQGQKFIEENPLVKWGTQVEAAIQEVNTAWEEQGKALPTEAIDQLRGKYEQLIGVGEKQGRSEEQIQEAIDNTTESMKAAAKGGDKMNTMQRAMSMGMTTMLRMFSPILLAFKAYQMIVKELNLELKLAAESMMTVALNQVKVAQLARQGINMGGTAAAQAGAVASKQGVGALGVQQTFGATVAKAGAMGLSSQQLYGLIDAGNTYAKVYGVNATQATEAFLSAIESGNVSALVQYGIVIDEDRIQGEALNSSLIKIGDTLTAEQRKLVIRNLVMRDSNKLLADYTATQTDFQKKQAQTNVALEASRVAVGKILTPFKEFVELTTNRALVAGLQLMYVGFMGLATAASVVTGVLAEMLTEFAAVWRWTTKKMTGEELVAFLDEKEVTRRTAAYRKTMFAGIMDITNQFAAVSDATDKTLDDAAQGTAQVATDAMGAFNMMVVEGKRIVDSHKGDIEGILQNWKDTLAQINADYLATITQAAASLAADLASIDEEFATNTEQAQRDHNKTMARMAEDHAVEMRRLEEDTQLELEDAVRSRDARAIRDILKRYRIERDRREEDYQITRRRRNEDYADQMAQMRREYLKRRAERQRQFEDEIAQAKAEKERRAAEADERYQKDMAELTARMAAEFELFLKANADLLGAHADMLGGMYDQLNAALGPGGWAEAFWLRYLAIIQGVYASIASAGRYVGGDQPYGPGGGSRARGGTFFATGPSTLAVGEIPERVDITPMSRQGVGADRRGGAGRDKITVALNIGLDDGLVAKVVDQSMQGVAEVIVEVSKGRR